MPVIINATNQLGEERCDCNPPITNLLLNLSNNAELIGGILPEDVDNGQDQEQDEDEEEDMWWRRIPRIKQAVEKQGRWWWWRDMQLLDYNSLTVGGSFIHSFIRSIWFVATH